MTLGNGSRRVIDPLFQQKGESIMPHRQHILATIGGATVVAVLIVAVIVGLALENKRLKGLAAKTETIDANLARIIKLESRVEALEKEKGVLWKAIHQLRGAEESNVFGPGGEPAPRFVPGSGAGSPAGAKP